MASPAAAAKIAVLEDLINERLKTELQRVLDERDRVHERVAQWLSQWCPAPRAAPLKDN
jgi:hypothetical protein